jgi:nucleotide-binding universal stress UspA family protein
MKILLAYDGSEYSDAAVEDLRYAGLPRENDVLVVSVTQSCMRETEAIAERARAHVQFQFPAWKGSSEALWGEPANLLHKTILWWKPDLVVMGSHGRSAAGRLLLGSVSLDVVHQAPCSVRVVRVFLRRPNTPERLLIATDGSPQATAVVAEVARRAWPEGTEVRVVSVAETFVTSPALVPAFAGSTFASVGALQVAYAADPTELARLRGVADESLARLRASGLTVSTTVLEGNPRDEVVAEANRWRADTIFVGSRGLGALDRLLLGSVSGAAVAHAHCTVEVVRQRWALDIK